MTIPFVVPRRTPPSARRATVLGIVMLMLSIATSVRADGTGAVVCADVDGNGTVSVTDAIQVLRAAVGLSNTCLAPLCDLNLDGEVTITDGVLALRLAAGLPAQTTCAQAQAAEAVARIQGTMDIGVALVPPASALSAGASIAPTPCPDGGTTTDNGNGFTDVDCRNGDLISNGTVTFVASAGAPQVDVSFQNFSVTRVSTGETLVSSTSGPLVVSRQGSTVHLNGTVSRSSNLLGVFSDTFRDVVAQDTGGPVSLVSGTVVTAITRGTGGFAHLSQLESNIVGPKLAIVLVTFRNTTQQVVIFADHIGLCDPCTSNATCDPELACLPCNSNCTGTPPLRCRVNFQNFAAQCSDGLF